MWETDQILNFNERNSNSKSKWELESSHCFNR
jgi:hypothetical protein